MEEEFKESYSSEYDERSQTLTAIKTYKKTSLISKISNEYKGEKSIKKFLKSNVDAKKAVQTRIDNLEKSIEELSIQEENIKKGLNPLTPDQEKLIEDLKLIQTYTGIEKIRDQIKKDKEDIEIMKDGMKKDNIMFEEIRNKCKIKL